MPHFYRRLQERQVLPFIEVDLAQLVTAFVLVTGAYLLSDKVLSGFESLEDVPTSSFWPAIIGMVAFYYIIRMMRRVGDGIKKRRGDLRHQLSARHARFLVPERPFEVRPPAFVVLAERPRDPGFVRRVAESLRGLAQRVIGHLRGRRVRPVSPRLSASDYVTARFKRQEY